MGRSSSYNNKNEGLKKGVWTAVEDQIVKDYVEKHGKGKWRKLSRETGLKRCGKSVRLRWLNYLRPGIVRGNIREDEEELIIRLHKLLGNRWSLIAGRIPGRTDNEIKNYWNSCLKRKLQQENHSEVPRNEKIKEEQSSYTAVSAAEDRDPEDNPHLTGNNVNGDEDYHQPPDVDFGAQFQATDDKGIGDDELLRDVLWWNNFSMNLNDVQLDVSEFQPDFPDIWESKMNVIDVGDCSTDHLENMPEESSYTAVSAAEDRDPEDNPHLTGNNVNGDEDYHQPPDVDFGAHFQATDDKGIGDEELLRDVLWWKNFSMNLNDIQLDVSEFQPDFPDIWESKMNFIDVGNCSTDHLENMPTN